MDEDTRVIDAGVRLFAERGYHGTGIRDLAREAGISLSTLYHHMQTKEDLLVDIMERGFTEMLTAARDVVAQASDPVDQLAALVRAHVRVHIERSDLANVVDTELRFLGAEARAKVMPLRDEYGGLWQDIVDAGASAGAFRVPDTHVARLAVLEMCNGVARWYSPTGQLPPDAIGDQFVRLVLQALGCEDRERSGSSGRS